MKRRLLLVDNEIDFVEILCESLAKTDLPIDIDTAFSVNEAQDKVLNRQYDLIITDVRMPHKSGIDLLVFLKEIDYPGLIFVMTAYDAKGNEAQLRSLGADDVFAKPFSLNWLARKVEQSLNHNPRGQLERIGLISMLQMINLDRKDALVQMECGDNCASIYLKKGELIHAEIGNYRGEVALMKIITAADNGELFIRPFRQKRIHHTIQLNFLEQMMQIVRLSDELHHRQQENLPDECGDDHDFERKRALQFIQPARSITGYWGVAVFNLRGEQLAVHCEIESLDLNHIGHQLLDAAFYSGQLSRATGIGQANMVHIETSDGFSALLHSHRSPFNPPLHTIMLLQPDTDLVQAKRQLLRLCDELLFPSPPSDLPE